VTGVKRVADRLGLDPRAVVGLAVVLGGLIVWSMAFTGGLAGLLSGPSTTVKADFASAEDVVTNDPVRINGVEVGKVSDVAADRDGRGATVTMQLDQGAGSIYANASAQIVWRTALGANDAVRLDPGTPSAGSLGSATIPKSRDSNQVELDQITQALHGGAQSGTQTILQQLPQALQDEHAPARAFTTLANVAPDAAAGIGALRGQTPDSDLKALVHQTGQAVQALSVGTGASETQRFVQSAATTLAAISASPQALQATISGLARVIPRSQPTFAALDHSLNLLDPLMGKLTPEVGQVAPTLQALHPTVTDADTLLHKATPLLHQLRPTVESLASTARLGVPVINALKPSLIRLQNKILPGVAKTYPETGGHGTYQMIGSLVTAFSNITSQFDSNGDLIDLSLGLAEPQDQQILPCTEDFSGTDFLVCQALSTSLSQVFSGGPSLMQAAAQAASGTGAQSIFQALGHKATSAGSQLDQLQRALAAKRPQVARYLFSTHRGAGR
jgi:phospholipid/cholesterol/gamma-HCH transport system substrate-binding protein